MKQVLDSVKGRIVLILLIFLSLSHLVGLWLYAQRSEAATTLLHDALLAERVAVISRLVEKTPPLDRRGLLNLVSGPLVRFSQPSEAALGEILPEGSRQHVFEHLLSVFLNRPTHDNIRIAYFASENNDGLTGLLAAVNGSAHAEIDHLPAKPLAEIHPIGAVATEIKLSDGTWLKAVSPLLSVQAFSPWKIGMPLAAMLASVLAVAAWVLHRWTQPLTYFASAAQRLGTDIHTPPLIEKGPLEVRTAARAFNLMQDRIRRLVQDRVAFAAAIAHDLGTPITRLHLRAEDISDASMREPILADLNQMRRMIKATLRFARLDFSAEAAEAVDVMSLVQRVCDDLIDVGDDVSVNGPPHVVIRTKPIALHRVMSNVIENAVKYGKCASVAVMTLNESIEISVDDTGPGIPETLQTEVFEPFRRLRQFGDDAVDGTGLGLTVARSLVRGLGGDITLRNRDAGGLNVTICLPNQKTMEPIAAL
ncbi:ATP-binding protein [Hyphomicrobium sp.]|jgi:signal transduction histidine kinase|uniref:ATP-binding protein n=1 Tax=Hyphomicrobium sp. TaxID=82 RepID=UPI0035691BB9